MEDTLISVNPRDFILREDILMLLSDTEVARVSTAEDRSRLVDGDEYIDLEHLEQGIRLVQADSRPPMGRVLPRSALGDDTWTKIVARLVAGKSSARG